jgi:uncharacterized protein (TIGR02391 family)
MWDHLYRILPQSIMAAIDDTVSEIIEDLEDKGFVKLGGKIGNSTYPADDWLLLSRKGVKAVSDNKTLLEPLSDDADIFDRQNYHEKIASVSRSIFVSGHYSQAIFEACKSLNNSVKEQSKLSDDGASLMTKAFSPNNPVLKINNLSNKSEKDEQQGFMHLYQGAILGIRNPFAHEPASPIDLTVALEYLGFLSLLFRKLDDTIN